jgi:hypothetical protein
MPTVEIIHDDGQGHRADFVTFTKDDMLANLAKPDAPMNFIKIVAGIEPKSFSYGELYALVGIAKSILEAKAND